MSNRDPFPYPRVENDLTFSGYRPQQKKTYNKPTCIAQTEEPWRRLHDTATLASIRRSILNCMQTQNDSLDLQLNAIYDHHKNCFWNKNQILYQKETISDDHRRGANLMMEEAENGITVVDRQRQAHHSHQLTHSLLQSGATRTSAQYEDSSANISNC